MFTRILCALAIVASAGCTTIAASGSTDWYAIGARDGRLGAYPQDHYLESRFSTSADRARYLRGWEDGFAQRPHPVS